MHENTSTNFIIINQLYFLTSTPKNMNQTKFFNQYLVKEVYIYLYIIYAILTLNIDDYLLLTELYIFTR